MQLHELDAFEAVAANRSFTRAAEALCLTQPAVTRQIASLERELKTRLFDRLGKAVTLTIAGEALHRYAVEILRLKHEAERAVGDVVTGSAGRIAVGANSTTATYLLPPILSQFRELHPGVELAVHTGPSAQVVEMVIANEVDVGIVAGYAAQDGLIGTPLTEYLTVVVVFPGHPLALGDAAAPIHTADLAGNPLILMEEGTNLRRYVDRLLSAAGVEERVRVTMELDNVEAIKKMIEAGLGISLLPLISVQSEVASGSLVALQLADVPNAQRRISAIHRRDKYLTVAVKAFLVLMRDRL
jgi:DNA-binding transcriptional LysR family regulator